MNQITCIHFRKNPKQCGYTYGLSKSEEIILCQECNKNLRKSMMQQLGDEAGLKLLHAGGK